MGGREVEAESEALMVRDEEMEEMAGEREMPPVGVVWLGKDCTDGDLSGGECTGLEKLGENEGKGKRSSPETDTGGSKLPSADEADDALLVPLNFLAAEPAFRPTDPS